MATPLESLQLARWQASKKVPYLANGLYAMTFVEAPPEMGLKTIAVDTSWRVYFCPEYIAKCAIDGTIQGEIIHECLHPTMRCFQRRDAIGAQQDHEHWNCCHDAEIDQRIEELGVTLVKDRVTPEALGGAQGMVAEELYRLPRQKQKSHCGGGSGAGRPLAGELGKPGEGAPGGLSEAEADLVRAATAAAIQKHAEAKGRGSVPGGLLRWAEDFFAPVPIDWRTLCEARVRHAVDTRRGSHPTYSRPSRRGDVGGFILPVYRTSIPTVGIVGDTSGSMGDSDLKKVIGVVWDAAATFGKVLAVACDARAGDPVEVRHVDDLREALRGGGGTDMRVGIAAAAESNVDAIVVATDGDTPWPDAPTDVPLIIVLTRGARVTPAWAETIIAD